MKQIYFNGKVYTGELPLCEAFVVEDGRFKYVGDSETAKALMESEDELVDLEGRFVCSGFIDSHMHVLGFGKTLGEAALAEHTSSLEEMLSFLITFSEEKKGNNFWILGRGWNQDFFTDEKRMPNRYDLDRVSTERPICLVRACGHVAVVNSKALEVLGITEKTPQPDGGQIGMEHGVPDGRFYENGLSLVYDGIPAPDKNEIKAMILRACEKLNSYGITSAQSDDYCTFINLNWKEINEAYRELEAEGKLTVRIYEQSNLTNLEELTKFVAEGNTTGSGTELFRFGPLKMLGDGALGARTAYLSKVYEDAPETRGIPVFSQKQFDEMISFANENGMQVAVHAIGDACLDMVIEAIEKALSKCPRGDHRHGIVHCQITRSDQLEKIAKMKLHVYAQSIFLDYDTKIVKERVGKEMAETSYSWKTLMENGVSVSNGSDCPVELPCVMVGIQCAVTRQRLGGSEIYLPEQQFTVQEALDSYTIRGAEGSFEEHKKGKIKESMFADFVILEENPFTAEPMKLKDISVRATFFNGMPVYKM